MTAETLTYDTLHMGRSCIDLYSNDIGAAFPDIRSFAAYVGGSPTNISVGTTRLGLRSALLTAVGVDPVADFVLQFLQREAVDTRFIVRKPGHRTSAVVLGIEPPDRFPLVYYRERCADIQLTLDDVLASPIRRCKVFQFAGTNLSQEPSRSATMFAAEQAAAAGAFVVLDLDFRPDQWHDPRAFGVAVRSVLRNVHLVLGTEDEINASLLTGAGQVTATESVSDTQVSGNAAQAAAQLIELGPQVVVRKRGPHGATLHTKKDQDTLDVVDVPGFPVEIENVLGAGDAFAAGFLYAWVHGRTLYQAARFGNACGAIVVTRHGCANFMPRLDEVEEFVRSRGGLD